MFPVAKNSRVGRLLIADAEAMFSQCSICLRGCALMVLGGLSKQQSQMFGNGQVKSSNVERKCSGACIQAEFEVVSCERPSV